MSIIKNKERIGAFTSSMIYKLIPKGKRKMTSEELILFKEVNPKSRVTTIADGFSSLGLTYIQEKSIERKIGKSIDGNVYNQAAYWGLAMELILFNLLGYKYSLSSQETSVHPEYKFWAGSCDALILDRESGSTEAVVEIKSYGLKKFSLYSDCLLKKDVSLFREEFPSEYWQIVSNCIIHDADIGEAICFAPYDSQMDEIRGYITDMDGDSLWKYRFIVEKENYELSCIPDDGFYKSINKFLFLIPEEDKQFLTQRVLEANKLLEESLKWKN